MRNSISSRIIPCWGRFWFFFRVNFIFILCLSVDLFYIVIFIKLRTHSALQTHCKAVSSLHVWLALRRYHREYKLWGQVAGWVCQVCIDLSLCGPHFAHLRYLTGASSLARPWELGLGPQRLQSANRLLTTRPIEKPFRLATLERNRLYRNAVSMALIALVAPHRCALDLLSPASLYRHFICKHFADKCMHATLPKTYPCEVLTCFMLLKFNLSGP